MLHRLATQLEHHKDDHLVFKDVTMMTLAIVKTTMIEQDIAIVITMVILMVTRTRQKPTTLAKVPRNMARMIRRSRVVPTWVIYVHYCV